MEPIDIYEEISNFPEQDSFNDEDMSVTIEGGEENGVFNEN